MIIRQHKITPVWRERGVEREKEREEGERENILKFVSYCQCVYFTIHCKINWLYTLYRTHTQLECVS